MASGITTKTYTPAGAYWVWAEWSSTINVANNTSSVTVISYVGSNSYGYYSSSSNTGSITVHGTVSSYASNSALAASTPKQELHRTTQTITHNADGTKSISISANHKHSTTFNLTSTATITLDTIPRTSPADLSVSSQAIGGAITVYTNRQSDTFTHTINYYFGNISTNLANNVGVSYVFTLPTAMAGQIPNASSGTGTIKVVTYSGSTYVGEVSLPFTATVPDNASYRPTATAVTSTIYGTGRDKTISKYVQGISKATLDFTATPYGYASIVSSSITIKRLSDNANPMVISGTSGTSGILTLGGVYTVIATTTDSRGRSTTGTPLSITVESYTVPVITSFTATRQATPNTASVDTIRNGTYTYMGGSNPLSVIVARAPRGGVYVNLETTAGTTSGTFTGTYVSTGNTDTTSWDFKLTILDSFGKSAIAMVTVSTASVALSIKGDIGIGVGKVWEHGALDVQGDMYISSSTLVANFNADMVDGKHAADFTAFSNPVTIDVNNTGMPSGIYRGSTGSWVDKPAFGHNGGALFSINTHTGGYHSQFWFNTQGNTFYHRSIDADVIRPWSQVWDAYSADVVIESGTNANGRYLKFAGGTMMAYRKLDTSLAVNVVQGNLYKSVSTSWTYPVGFYEAPTVSMMSIANSASPFWISVIASYTTTCHYMLVSNATFAAFSQSHSQFAIGRWKA